MGKNWAELAATGAKAALLTAGLVVIGSGAAHGDPITDTNLTSPVGPALSAVGKVTGQNAAVPVAVAKKRLDEPQPVLPGSPIQSSAINTAPALEAIATAQNNLAQHTPGGGAAMSGLDKAGAAVKGATAGAPGPLAKKGPIPGVSDKQISVPANADEPGSVGTPLNQEGLSDAVGGTVDMVTGAVSKTGLAGK